MLPPHCFSESLARNFPPDSLPVETESILPQQESEKWDEKAVCSEIGIVGLAHAGNAWQKWRVIWNWLREINLLQVSNYHLRGQNSKSSYPWRPNEFWFPGVSIYKRMGGENVTSRQEQSMPSSGMSISYHNAIWLMTRMAKIECTPGKGVAGMRLEVSSPK